MKRTFVTLLLGFALMFTQGIPGFAHEQSEVSGEINIETTDKKLIFEKYSIGTDFQGAPMLSLLFDYTNNSSTANLAYSAFPITVYQNGIECTMAFPDYDFEYQEEYDNSVTSIKDGATLPICFTFELRDTTSQVEVSVMDLTTLRTMDDAGLNIDISKFSTSGSNTFLEGSSSETESVTQANAEQSSVENTGNIFEGTVQIANLELEIPSQFTYLNTREDGDYTIYTYTTETETLQIFATPYDEDLGDLSDILVGAMAAGFEARDGYSEITSSKTTIDGHTVHLDSFFIELDGVYSICVDVSVNTGTHIIDLIYSVAVGDEETAMDSFGTMIDNMNIIGETSSSATTATDISVTKFSADNYKVGTDIPAGEYVVYAQNGYGYFCVSSDSNQDDILFNENFDYNSIITIQDGDYLELYSSYAVPMEEDPALVTTATGMFKVGTHIPAGEYKLEATDGSGYYCIYPDSRQDDILANNLFEGQNYVTVSDGQYLVLSGCKFTEPPAKPLKSYTDADTVLKVQEALNAAGYDCGTPDGIAGSGTKAAVESYQADHSLTITGTITDELLSSLGL